MQNSLVFNDAIQYGFKFHVTPKAPQEVKAPDIKPLHTHKLSDRDMELCMTEQQENYTPFKITSKPPKPKAVMQKTKGSKVIR